ncbi:MAG: D-alanine--D-alanine ligase [bacterium]
MTMKRVAVLMGGTSNERDVSLRSGGAVVRALQAEGLEVVPVVLECDSIESLPRDIDAVFLALHGGYGENGGVQQDLDQLSIPYTGPGAAASRIAMDKIATKKCLEAAKLPTPPYDVLTAQMTCTMLQLPVVVKPPRDGSSVGISKVTEPSHWNDALAAARAIDPDGEVLVEQYIPGREWTVSVIGGVALPVVEICAPNGWYGFTEKYTQGMTQYLFPEGAENATLILTCQKLAVQAFHAIGCRGVSRVDFRITPEGNPFILEINTLPGLTATSLLPKAAARAGESFGALCLHLLKLAAHH